MLPEFMNLLRKFYFMRAAARNAKRQSDFFDRPKRAVNLHVIHGSFSFPSAPGKPFYYCYSGILHNSDILFTDNPALYHNYSVYIFLTPLDSYSPYRLQSFQNLFPYIIQKSTSYRLTKIWICNILLIKKQY